MISTAALAPVLAILAQAGVADVRIQHGAATTLITFDAGRRMTPVAFAQGAVREGGLRHVATRDLADGRVAMEIEDARSGTKGISALCHHNAALGLDALAAAGWNVAR